MPNAARDPTATSETSAHLISCCAGELRPLGSDARQERLEEEGIASFVKSFESQARASGSATERRATNFSASRGDADC